MDETVTVVEATSSNEEEQAADVGSHPLPDMFGAQVGGQQQCHCMKVHGVCQVAC